LRARRKRGGAALQFLGQGIARGQGGEHGPSLVARRGIAERDEAVRKLHAHLQHFGMVGAIDLAADLDCFLPKRDGFAVPALLCTPAATSPAATMTS
jgi:hypothetical protein